MGEKPIVRLRYKRLVLPSSRRGFKTFSLAAQHNLLLAYKRTVLAMARDAGSVGQIKHYYANNCSGSARDDWTCSRIAARTKSVTSCAITTLYKSGEFKILSMGYAFCSITSQDVRTEGHAIARGRALKAVGLDTKLRTEKEITCALRIPSPVQ